MSWKRDSPGSPCCDCCPSYQFQDSANMGYDNNLRFPVAATSPAQSTTGTVGKSARFQGSSFYELTTAEGRTWPTRRSWCFTPSVINQSFASKWIVKFAMKVVTEPSLPQTQTMGVLTRCDVTGVLPTGTFLGEWGVISARRNRPDCFFCCQDRHHAKSAPLGRHQRHKRSGHEWVQ